ncbi:MAG TPA: ATP-binding protein [Dongiaceae bacterium]|nr:ATP-binding protein [Dongiaceae bacterium]
MIATAFKRLLKLASGCLPLLAAGWGHATTLTAPDYSRPWQVKAYANVAGLEHRRVFDIAFTPDNTAWLAVDDGLRKFDGFDWARFGTNAGLPSTFVRAVCVDTDNRLWVGSDAGAGIFDVRQNRYESPAPPAGLANLNVREIDCDPEGTLWFSCDQWPESNIQPGGLSRLKAGQWKTFTTTNGLPMNYVIGYFRDTTGRQFALTPHGWAQRQEGQWGPPLNPGYQAEDCILHLAEAGDGTLFAQGEHLLLLLQNGQWRPAAGNRTRLVCSLRDGGVAAVEYDPATSRLWFSLWDGTRFVAQSAPVSCPLNARLYHLREAPDGALWCVGYGTVVRWNYRAASRWTAFSQLPPPVDADARGRVWFAGNSNILVRAGEQFLTLPPGEFKALNKNGSALFVNARTGQWEMTSPDNPLIATVMDPGCAQVNSVYPDYDDGFWISGQDTNGASILTHYEHGKTSVVAPDAFRDRKFVSATPEAPDRLWVVANRRDTIQYDIALVEGNRVTWQNLTPAPPPLTYPAMLIGADHHWLVGYPAIYEQTGAPTGNWQKVTAFAGVGFSTTCRSATEALFLFNGGIAGQPGCALFSQGTWKTAYGDFSHAVLAPDEHTLYLSGYNAVYLRRQPGTLDLESLPTPEDEFVHVVVPDHLGNLWLGTSEGVLRYQPTSLSPRAMLAASVTEIPAGQPLPVTFGATRRYENSHDNTGYRYSWRVDQREWSDFIPGPRHALSLTKLKPGLHELQVRARDADGNISPEAATLPFTVQPAPVQQQPWFWLLVAVVLALLGWLVGGRISSLRKIAEANTELRAEVAIRRQAEAALQKSSEDLERRVVERTAELTRANTRLGQEMAERLVAEASQRKLEEQLHQAQKMEAIGTLAGGIAHDFNNILAIVIPYTEMAISDTAGQPELQDNLHQILGAAERAKKLVQQILTFSRQQNQEQLVVDLQPVVAEALQLLRSAVPSTIEMVSQLKPVHPVLASPTQMHQVVMNLCVNATQAMADRQGRLTVSLDEVTVDRTTPGYAELLPGLYVRLAVTDTGCGMTAEVQQRIFDPFFTTKETGQGTGLGLAVVHGIVKNHNGFILVESRPGEGAKFEVLLPAQTAPLTTRGALPPVAIRAHGEHLLIVDDERGIISVLKQLLTRRGYHVTAHTDPLAAREDFLARPDTFHLVLTDLTMPGLDGVDLAREIYKVRPDLPVIVATGFGSNLLNNTEIAGQTNIRKLVEKPLDGNAIIRAIVEVLAATPPANLIGT